MNTRQLPEINNLFHKVAERLNELPLVAEEGQEPAKQIAETARCLFSSDYAAVLTPEIVSEQEFRPLAVAGAAPLTAARRQWLAGLVTKALGQAAEVVIKEPAVRPEDGDGFTSAEGIIAYAIITLRSDNGQIPLAILQLERQKERSSNFNESELEAFARRVQKLLYNAWLTRLAELVAATREQIVNAENIIKALIDWLRELTHADLVTVFPYFEDLQRFDDMTYISGERRQPKFYRPKYYRRDDIAWLAIRHRRAEFAVDGDTLYARLAGPMDVKRLGDFQEREGILSVALLPLLAEGELVGVLFFNYRQRQEFVEEQCRLLLNLAGFAAQTVKGTRERGEMATRHAQTLNQFQDIDREISEIRKLGPLLRRILEIAQRNIPAAEDASIRLYDPDNDTLATEAAEGPYSKRRYGHTLSLSKDKDSSIICWACDNQTAVRIGDVTSPEWKARYHQVAPYMFSEMVMPLLDGEELVAVINLESPQKDAFSLENQNFLAALANRVVLAIKNARIYERMTLYQEETEAIISADRKISLSDLLKRLLDKALMITKSENGGIWLYDARWDDLYLVAGKGIKPGEERVYLNVEEQGIVSWVVKNRKPLIADASDPEWGKLYKALIPGMRWQLSAPIIKSETEVRGVIAVERPSERAFTVDDLNLLSQMANLAEIALRLAAQAKGQERLTALHEVDVKLIVLVDDADSLMWSILEQALQLTEADQGSLHLYEVGKPLTTYFAVKEGQTSVRREKHNEIPSYQQGHRGIVDYVARTRMPFRTHKDAQSDQPYVGASHTHGEVAVPLLRGSELIGVLNLASEEHNDLSEDDIDLLTLLAGQAVIAIQNARNYKQAREESRRFRILRDVGKQLSQITDLDEVMQAYEVVVEPLKDFSTGWITIRRYDEITQTLICEWHGGHGEGRTKFRDYKVGIGVSGYIAQRWLSEEDRSGNALIIADVKNPPPGITPAPVSEMVRSLVSAPVFYKEMYYGNLTLSHEDVGYFNKNDADLIEGLAEQLGLTLHRLEVARAEQERLAKSKAKEDLAHYAASVAHHFGNIFKPIITQADRLRRMLVEQESLSPEVERHLNAFIQRGDRASKLNKRFKAFAEVIRTGTTCADPPERVVLRQLLDEVIKNADFNSSEDGQDEGMSEVELKQSLVRPEFEYEFEAGLAEVKIVAEQIIDVLSNLISNACEVMPKGGRLTFNARNLERHVELRVTDTGPGIPEKNRSKIFEYGYSTKKSTGFGLSISQYYASINGGELKLDTNHQGRGATFILLLPRADD